MLRQTLRSFVDELKSKFPTHDFTPVDSYLTDKKFHKRLRDEITMIPIPKFKITKKMSSTGMSCGQFKDWIIEQQKHVLEWAINRVRYYFQVNEFILCFS